MNPSIDDHAIFYASLYYSDEDGNGASDCMIGLAQGNPGGYSSYACIIRFRSDIGFVDAHNGSEYTYDAANPVPLGKAFGVKYEAWFDVDVRAGSWTPWVKGPGMAAPVKILDHAGFRAKNISRLDTWKAVHQNTGDDGLDVRTVGRVAAVGDVPPSYDEASIASVEIQPDGLNQAWDTEMRSYTATFPNGTAYVDISAVPLQNGTTISGTGKMDLSGGKGRLTLTATSESGAAARSYVIDWRYTDPTKDATLSSLKITDAAGNIEYGKLRPDFSPTVDAYTIDLPYGLKSIRVQAAASAASNGARVSGAGVVYVVSDTQTETITVTSADGTAAKTYQLLLSADKKRVFFASNMGDMNNPSNQWRMERSKKSDNWIVFWEAGYGLNPNDDADDGLRVDVDNLLAIAEKSYKMYSDTLKFIEPGRSKADQYKMMILLYYTKDWIASGSGVDQTIGQLNLSAWGARAGAITIAHEVGHCFQYQSGADQHPFPAGQTEAGWKWGLGDDGEGGNGWWEQCAQWQAFKVNPEQQFTTHEFKSFLGKEHTHLLHEDGRYQKYFIQDYWTYLHSWDFIGRMWRETRFSEDPVETYQRLTGVSQSRFNDEMYECAARFATWDIPHLAELGKSHILDRPANPLLPAEDGRWIVDPKQCIENYGYNIVRLNAPDVATRISVFFEGKAGMDGYRAINVQEAGWRYGFVALLKNGARVYSDMASANYDQMNNSNPSGALNFDCPDDCEDLWFVVSGAPQRHWRHKWDDDVANDEQWPYQVKFANTNPFGAANPD
ncbi:cadherin-like beta sandwich domain-containing protein [Candidatus Sumerlaeota bacterium]|nr:cadherin-like beta sandwich domain-containing protein [Candidatus Sumerlaeota bacterium]